MKNKKIIVVILVIILLSLIIYKNRKKPFKFGGGEFNTTGKPDKSGQTGGASGTW